MQAWKYPNEEYFSPKISATREEPAVNVEWVGARPSRTLKAATARRFVKRGIIRFKSNNQNVDILQIKVRLIISHGE